MTKSMVLFLLIRLIRAIRGFSSSPVNGYLFEAKGRMRVSFSASSVPLRLLFFFES